MKLFSNLFESPFFPLRFDRTIFHIPKLACIRREVNKSKLSTANSDNLPLGQGNRLSNGSTAQGEVGIREAQ